MKRNYRFCFSHNILHIVGAEQAGPNGPVCYISKVIGGDIPAIHIRCGYGGRFGPYCRQTAAGRRYKRKSGIVSICAVARQTYSLSPDC